VDFLTIGSILFALGGLFDALIGLATPFVTRLRPLPLDALLVSHDADVALLGDSPQHLLDTIPALAAFYRLALDWIGGLLVVFGVAVAAIAWFALRQGQWWGLWCVVGLDLVFFATWALIYSTYLRSAAPVTLTTAPPNLVVPALLFVPAFVAPFVGLRAVV
jgi:hypothetical protein